jgi:hypothetical protein
MASKLKNIKQALEEFNVERIFWLKLSIFMVVVLLSTIWKWDFIQSYHLGWLIFTIGTSASVLWWYWTMKLIRTTLYHRKEEVDILIELVEDIKAIKNQVKDLDK